MSGGATNGGADENMGGAGASGQPGGGRAGGGAAGDSSGGFAGGGNGNSGGGSSGRANAGSGGTAAGTGGANDGGAAGAEALCPDDLPEDTATCSRIGFGAPVICTYGSTNCYCAAIFASRWDCGGCPDSLPVHGASCDGFQGETCGGCGCSASSAQWDCGAGGG